MAEIKINKLEKLVKEYLDSLNESEDTEYYGTDKEIAQGFMLNFMSFVKRDNAIQDAITLLDNNSYNVGKKRMT